MKVFKLFLVICVVPVLLLIVGFVKTILFFKKKKIGKTEYILYNSKAKAFVGTSIEVLKNLGGVFILYQSKELLSKTVRDKTIPMQIRMMALMASPGYSVCVVKDIIPEFTKDELKAIIAHEFGHMVAGHLEQGTGIIYNINFEIEADDYAVAQTSAAALKSALIKMRDQDISRFDQVSLTDINLRIERL